ncbi:hypothetical protein O3M35_001253 [Rhynocoris fuscipes]|uniref:BMP-binding endothelial regulator protein n=2 Tax=Rhynocoris fuscipes TaxID=488301 RepID=A0AAW1DTI1_9HEMI
MKSSLLEDNLLFYFEIALKEQNGFVECHPKEQCPSQEGCHVLLEPPKDGCCRRCKGCYYKGVLRESGSSWQDVRKPCTIFTCKAGVITETEEKCYVPCSNPMPPAPGHCCPTCNDCRVNGQLVSANRTVRSMEDPCLRCACTKGRLSCSKRACPVLNCSPQSIIPPRPGECCPKCKGSRELIVPPLGRCLLGSELLAPGRTYRPDRCTDCSCANGTSVCIRPSCPVLDCPPELQTTKQGECCPSCPTWGNRPLSTTCTFGHDTYKDGETWEIDKCTSCVCRQGRIRCAAQLCPQTNKACPPNHKLVTDPGQCCPKCVESDGVCTVFGDPHYRTFDGKFYSFQGPCKYQLAADCANNTFSIRVTNDARATKTSSWTKTVSVKVSGTKINLGEKRRVKINGERVQAPYESKEVSISETEESVLVEAKAVGLRLLWDGNSFLEVSVPAAYKGKLCGLCGNFNSISRDDLMTRTGRIVMDADKFGWSWRVGGKKACSRGKGNPLGLPSPHESHRCSKFLPHRRFRERMCKPLRSDIFAACHKHLNHLIYFKSCLLDMCECPSRRCYCESFTAYAHECARQGVTLPNWRSATNCYARH